MKENEKNNIADEEMYVEIELDEGTVKCSIVTIFEVEDKDYIALLPLDENGENISEPILHTDRFSTG